LSSFLAKELLSERRLAQQAAEQKRTAEHEPRPRRNDSRLQLPGESAEEALVRLRANPDHAPPLTVEPPAQKPFEHIDGLDRQLAAARHKLVKPEIGDTAGAPRAEYMLTTEQYHGLFSQYNLADADIVLRKLH